MEVLSYILTAFDELLKMNVLSTIVAKNEGLLQSIKAILFHLKMKKTRAFLVWKLTSRAMVWASGEIPVHTRLTGLTDFSCTVYIPC